MINKILSFLGLKVEEKVKESYSSLNSCPKCGGSIIRSTPETSEWVDYDCSTCGYKTYVHTWNDR